MATSEDFVGFALKQCYLHRVQISLERGAPEFRGPRKAARLRGDGTAARHGLSFSTG